MTDKKQKADKQIERELPEKNDGDLAEALGPLNLQDEGLMTDANTDDQDQMVDDASNTEDEIEALKQALEAARQEAASNLDTSLRTRAEMDNLRKRTAREVENAHKYALEKFVAELLPVIDSLELGLSVSENAERIEDLRDGMALTLKKFTSTMEKFDVLILDPMGEKFNPDQHEAISMQAVEGQATGTVLSVMQKGYELNGRLVRPAMVSVAK